MRTRLLVGVIGLLMGTAAIAQDQAAAPPVDAAAAPAAAEPPAAEAAPAVAVAAAPAGPALPGDAARGESKAAACGACHGIDGNASDPMYPKIAGQHELYTARQLAMYKSGERENAIMLGFASTLSAQDMRDIGAYYATKKAAPGIANDAKITPEGDFTWVQRGEHLYRGGDAVAGTPACMACHGPNGRGNPGAKYPAIGGQHADYTKAQLAKFREGTVYGAGRNANAVMAGVTAQLSDQDIEALATYLEGLHHAAGPIAGGK